MMRVAGIFSGTTCRDSRQIAIKTKTHYDNNRGVGTSTFLFGFLTENKVCA